MRPVWIRSRIIELNDANLDRLPEYDYSEKGITYEVYGIPENQPTVDAIPVEWLKKHSWYGVIEHWEKDQKLNNSKEVLYSLLEDHGFNSYEEYINFAEAIMAIPKDDRVKFLERERKNEESASQTD